MKYIRITIPGIPYARNKSRGNLGAPKEWTEAVKERTATLPKFTEACLLRITYMLPRSHIPSNYPFGTDLDNLNS